MTVSVWQANGTQPVREVDFLIVGAGLVGCSAAYFAGQLGRQVTITDTRDVALGASSRNAGFMITGLDTYYHHAIERYGDAVVRDIWGLSITTHSHLRHFIKNGNVPIDPCGSTLLAESPEEARDLEDAARALDAAKLGLDFEYCSSDPLGRGYYAAIRQRQDAAVQPYQLVQSIFKQSGAELIANNEMYRIEQPDSDHVLVYTRQYIFKARDVLLCTNAYSIHVDPYFVGKVIPTRAQILVTAPLKERVVNTCGYSDYGYMYYRDTFDGRLLIGGGRKQNKALENDTTDDRVTDPVQRILEAYLRDKFPDIDAPVEQRWAGIMGFTVDGLPLVGTLPGKPRVAFCIACHGHGLALGAGTAERAVEMVVNGTNPGAVSASRL